MRKIASLALIGILGLAGVIGLAPYAFGQESSNPLAALWDAIYDLQRHDDNLQAQIDELKVSRDESASSPNAPSADPKVSVDILGGSPGEFTILLRASNDGPDRAAGVRITMFYKMSSIEVDNISGEGCRDLSRGIIQCDLGTLEAGGESTVSVEARQIGEDVSVLTVDLSSTTTDTDPANNRYVAPIEVSLVDPEEPEETIPEEPEENGPEEEPVPEQDEEPSDGAGGAGNQTSDQPGNSTSDDNASTTTEPENSEEQSGEDTSTDPQSSGTEESDEDSTQDEGSSEDDGESSENDDQQADPPSDTNQTSTG